MAGPWDDYKQAQAVPGTGESDAGSGPWDEFAPKAPELPSPVAPGGDGPWNQYAKFSTPDVAPVAPVDTGSPDYVSEVKKSEGFTPKAEWDYKQNSVGYGTKAKYPGEVIDKAEADRRFNEEFGSATSRVDQFAPDAPQGVKAALSSLTYNAGPGWMNSGLGQAVKSGDYKNAEHIFRQYINAGGEVNPGLVARRNREAQWFDDPPGAQPVRSHGGIQPPLTTGSVAGSAPGEDPDLITKIFSLPANKRSVALEQELHNILGLPIDLTAPAGTLGRGGVPIEADTGQPILPERNPQRQVKGPWEAYASSSTTPDKVAKAEAGPWDEYRGTAKNEAGLPLVPPVQGKSAKPVNLPLVPPKVEGPATFMESMSRGVDIAQQMGYGAAEATGELTGLDSLRGWGKAGREANTKEINAARAPRAQFTDIGGAGDFGQWVKETVGEQIPLMAPSIAGSLGGGAAGAVLGPLGATVGAVLGAFVPSLVLGVGETQTSIKDKDPNSVAPGWAFAGGTAIGALDSVLPGKIGGKLVSAFGRETAEAIAKKTLEKPVADGFVKRTAKGAASGMAVEGLTEALQEAIGEVAAAKGSKTPIDWDSMGQQMIEAGAAGGLLGLGGGAFEANIGHGQEAKVDQSQPGSSVSGPPPIPSSPASPTSGVPAAGSASAGGVEPQGAAPRNNATPPPVPASVPVTAAQEEPERKPVVISDSDRALLNGQGWSNAAIEEMGPEEIQDEVGYARQQGTSPLASKSGQSMEPAEPAEPAKSATKPSAGLAPDEPTAEPVRDLVAQAKDLQDSKNPRAAVWLPKSSIDRLAGDAAARKEILGSGVAIDNFDGKGGVLVAKDQQTADLAVKARDQGQEFQSIIGGLVGSGVGKPADGTHVVQQITKDGAVTRESLTTQADLAKTIADLKAPGRDVRTITPEEALRRRTEEASGAPPPLPSQAPSEIQAPPAVSGTVPPPVPKSTPPPLPDAGKRSSPVDIKSAEDLDQAVQAAKSDYTHAQGEANNRQLGHAKWNGLDVSIETEAGGVRKGVDPKSGKTWESKMAAPYGYFRGTEGGDGMHVDVFIGSNPESKRVFVLDELDRKTGEFRQHKTFIGFNDQDSAVASYTGSNGKSAKNIGGVTEMGVDDFKSWLHSGKLTKPLSDLKSQKAAASEAGKGDADKKAADDNSELSAIKPENEVKSKPEGEAKPDKKAANEAATELSLRDREAKAREFMDSPEWTAASTATDLNDTTKQEGFGTPEWMEARRYYPEGLELVGVESALDYLARSARKKVAGRTGRDRHAIILLGLPGAGKTTISDTLRDKFRAAHLTADDAKLIIPEYNGGNNSQGVHLESTYLAEMTSQRMRERGENMIIETIGSNRGSVEGRAEDLAKDGYKVSLVLADVPKAIAMERAIERYHRTGRVVPANLYDRLDLGEVYDRAKGSGLFADVARIEGSGRDWTLQEATNSLAPLEEYFQYGAGRDSAVGGRYKPAGGARSQQLEVDPDQSDVEAVVDDGAVTEPSKPREPYDGPALSDEEIDIVVDTWKYVREIEAKPKPESLSSYVVRNGGLRDEVKDVRHIAGSAKERPGLVNKNGVNLDDAALSAWEAGFFPNNSERPTIAEFLDSLQDDLHTGEVVRSIDHQYMEDVSIASQMAEELKDYGISARGFLKEETVREHLGQKREAKPRERTAVKNEAAQEKVEVPFDTHEVDREAVSNPVKTDKPKQEAKKPQETVSEPKSPEDQLRDRLLGDGFKTIVDARSFAKDLGITGDKKSIDETVERAVVAAARWVVDESNTVSSTYDSLVELYANQPNLAVRTSESMANQAYSTPVPLAYIASRLAGVAEAKVVYEPSAGNGALLIEAGVNPKQKVFANEIDVSRMSYLAHQGFVASSQDASLVKQPSAISDLGPAQSVIMNPPFGAIHEGGESKTFEVAGEWSTTQIDHAIALNGLQNMSDNGKAVLLLGGVKDQGEAERRQSYRGKGKREFYFHLYSNYNVVDHFTVAGELYQKQGAGWPVDAVVIDGRKKSDRPLPAAQPPTIYRSWEDLKAKLPEDGNVKPVAKPDRADDNKAAGSAVERSPGPARGDVGHVTPVDRSEPVGLPPRSGDDTQAVRKDGDRGQPGDARADSRDANRVQAGIPGERGRADKLTAAERKRLEPNTTGQSRYLAASKQNSLESLVPASMVDANRQAMARIEERHGGVDGFVAGRLNYKPEELGQYFSAEQIDALASAIDNVERGSALILGDQTGQGKGRVGAGMIRYAILNKMVPVLFTEKPDLYGDMYRDMRDIGLDKMLGHEPRMFMTNLGAAVSLDEEALAWQEESEAARKAGTKVPPRRGKFLTSGGKTKQAEDMAAIVAGREGFDVVFTTYDQMNTVKGETTERRKFISNLMPKAMLIMDEAHNAGGTQNARSSKEATPDRAAFARELATRAKGMMYSSATYAKRPDNMDLYLRTDMGKAVDDPKDLPNLIAKGGVPMQQIVATMLADSGQYLRREKSFEGISYEVEGVPINPEAYSQFSDAVRSVFQFDLAVSEFRKTYMEESLDLSGGVVARDDAVGESAASSTNFAQIMHNVVSQMLLAITAEPAAQRVIAAARAGEKPVIGLSNTMESFLTDYAQNEGIETGGAIDLSFGNVLGRYLERTLRITIKHPDGKIEHVQIPHDALPTYLQKQYDAAQSTIEHGDYESLPASPIDWIRMRLKEAGLSVAEVTGRGTMIDYSEPIPAYVKRPKKEMGPTGKRSSIAAFNRGALDVLIINRSGSTGVSMHSSSKFKDQRKRRMILVQADNNIDTHLQMLGRVNRTGQVNLPSYSHLAPEVPAVARPTAVLMKKMASLNANTTGARKSVFMSDSVDFMNEYGDQIVAEVMMEDPELHEQLGSPVKTDNNGKLIVADAARRVTGRIVLLDPEAQADILDRIQSRYRALIEHLDALGENALEAKTVDLKARKLESVSLKDRTGSGPFLDSVQIEKLSVKSPGRAMTPDQVVSEISDKIKVAKPTGDEAQIARTIGQLGRAWMQKKSSEVVQIAQGWIKADVSATSEEAQQRTEARHRDALRHWIAVADIAHPGATVALGMPGGDVTGIVLAFEKTGKTKMPVAGSAWSVTIAVPDSARSYTFPISKLFPPSTSKSDDEVGATIKSRPLQMDEMDQLLSGFHEATKEGREERFMVTGNILSGYDQTNGKGQIVNFTMEDGTLAPGIIMPRGFTVSKFMDSRRVKFRTAEQVVEFLRRGRAQVKSTDGIVTLDYVPGSGSVYVETPAGRGTGGRYFTDTNVRNAANPTIFEKRGSKMRAEIPPGRASDVISALLKVGAIFETSQKQDLAQEVIRTITPAPIAAPVVTGAAASSRVSGFAKSVQDLKSKHGIETRSDRKIREGATDVDFEDDAASALRAIIPSINDQVSGGRLPAVERAAQELYSIADETMTIVSRHRDIADEGLSVLDRKDLQDALYDLSDVLDATIQEGYDLDIKIGDFLSEVETKFDLLVSRLGMVLDGAAEANSDINARIEELLDVIPEVEEAETETSTDVVPFKETQDYRDLVAKVDAFHAQMFAGVNEDHSAIDAMVIVDKNVKDKLADLRLKANKWLHRTRTSMKSEADARSALDLYDHDISSEIRYVRDGIRNWMTRINETRGQAANKIDDVRATIKARMSGLEDANEEVLTKAEGLTPAIGGDNVRRMIALQLKSGKTVTIGKSVVDRIHAVLRDNEHMLPEGSRAYALAKIEPRAAGEINAVFVDPHGETYSIVTSWNRLDAVRAFHLGGDVFFIRPTLTGEYVNNIRAELGHEVTHALIKTGRLPADVFARLVRHGRSLRLLDGQLGTYLKIVGDPSASKVDPGDTVRAAYEAYYAGRPNIQGMLREEYATHLVEWYMRNELLPMEVDPVRDILDGIVSGKYSGRSESVTDRAMSAALASRDPVDYMDVWPSLLSKGARQSGDISVSVKGSIMGPATYTAKNSAGETVGTFRLRVEGSGNGASVTNAQVEEDHRRQGIARRVYDLISSDLSELGYHLKPQGVDAGQMSEDAFRFWMARDPSAIIEASRDIFAVNDSTSKRRVAAAKAVLDNDISAAIAGVRSKTVNRASYATAERMEVKGRSIEQIRHITGWYRGPDMKWRHEIDDSSAKLINLDKHLGAPKKGLFRSLFSKGRPTPAKLPSWVEGKAKMGLNIPLGELLDHPKLFAAYPFLSKMRASIIVGEGVPANKVGAALVFREEKGKIIYSPIKIMAKSEGDILSSLMHEIQHYIQHKEGFAVGSNYGNPQNIVTGRKADFSLNTGKITYPGRIFSTSTSLDLDTANKTESLPMTAAEQKALQLAQLYKDYESGNYGLLETKENMERWFAHIQAEMAELLTVRPIDYVYSTGEVEARQVQNRLAMTVAERAVVPVDYGKGSLSSTITGPNLAPVMDEMLRRAGFNYRLNKRRQKAIKIAPGITGAWDVNPLDETTYLFRVYADVTAKKDDRTFDVWLNRDTGRALIVFGDLGREDIGDEPYSSENRQTSKSQMTATRLEPMSDERLNKVLDSVEGYVRSLNLMPSYDPRILGWTPRNRNDSPGAIDFLRERDPYFMFDIDPVSDPEVTQMPIDLEAAGLDHEVWKIRSSKDFDDSMANWQERISSLPISTLKALYLRNRVDWQKNEIMEQRAYTDLYKSNASFREFAKNLVGSDWFAGDDAQSAASMIMGDGAEVMTSDYFGIEADLRIEARNRSAELRDLKQRVDRNHANTKLLDAENGARGYPIQRWTDASESMMAALGGGVVDQLGVSKEVDKNGFYSPSLEAAKRLTQEKGTVYQLREMLLKGGAQAKELDAVGFDKAFADPNAKVTRAELEKYLRDNRIQLGSVRLSGPMTQSEINMLSPDDYAGQGLARYQAYSTRGGTPGTYREIITTLPPARGQPQFDPSKVEIKRNRRSVTQGTYEIIYDGRRLAGPYGDDGSPLTNYMIPDAEIINVARDIFEAGDQHNKVLPFQDNYTSSHWKGIANPVLHYRQKDFLNHADPTSVGSLDKVTQPGGDFAPEVWYRGEKREWDGVDHTSDLPSKTRVVDEVQSDWSQRGRDKGVRDVDLADLIRRVDEANLRYKSMRSDAVSTIMAESHDPDSHIASSESVEAWLQKHNHFDMAIDLSRLRNEILDLKGKIAAAEVGVPWMPWLNTSDWVALGWKQILMDAAKDPTVSNVAFAPGSVQAQRYGMETRADDLYYDATEGRLFARRYGREVLNQSVPEDKIAGIVGEDAARRLLASYEIETNWWGSQLLHLNVLGLKFGGEGHKKFYGDVTPEGYQLGIVGIQLQNIIKKLDPEARISIYDVPHSDPGGTIEEINGDFRVDLPNARGTSWFTTREEAERFVSGVGARYPSIPMTDTLRAKLLEGLPLFGDIKPGRFEAALSTSTDPRVMFSDLAPEQKAKLESDLREAVQIVARIAGSDLQVKFWNQIESSTYATPEQIEASGGAATGTAGGFYQPGTLSADALVGLAVNDPSFDLRTSAGHEAWHHVKESLATADERRVLAHPAEQDRMRAAAALELGLDLDSDVIQGLPPFEVEAYAFQRYRREREEGMSGSMLHIATKRLFDRIIAVLRAVRNLIEMGKYGSHETIFEAARSGEIANRTGDETSINDVITAVKDYLREGKTQFAHSLPDVVRAVIASAPLTGRAMALEQEGDFAGAQRLRKLRADAFRRALPKFPSDLRGRLAGLLSAEDARDRLMAARLERRAGSEVSAFSGVVDNEGITPAGSGARGIAGDLRSANLNIGRAANEQASARVENFIDDMVYDEEGSSVTQTEAYEAYSSWAEQNSLEPVDLGDFRKVMKDSGVKVSRVKGQVQYIGIALSELGPDMMFNNIPRNANQTIASSSFLGRRAWGSLMRAANLKSPQWDQARVYLQDRMLPVKRLQERIEHETGTTIPSALNVYQAEALFQGKPGELMSDHQTKWVEPLIELMRESDIDLTQLGDYLYARHAGERNEVIAKRHDDQPDSDFVKAMTDPSIVGGSGLSTNEINAILELVRKSGKQGQYDELTAMVDGMQAETLDTMIRSGLMSRENVDEWKSTYQNYVPLRGFDVGREEPPDGPKVGGGIDIRGRESMAALGRRDKADNPVVYALMQAHQAIIRSEKNRVAKTMYRAIEAYPDPAVWNLFKGEARRRINPSTGFVETYWVPPAHVHHDNIHGVKFNGKQFFMELKHPGVARSMRGVGSEIQGTLLGRGLIKLMRFYAQMLTSWNPEFMFGNFPRDIETALFNISDIAEKPAGARRQIIKDALSTKSIRGVLNALRGDVSGEYAQWFEEYRHAGGKISFMEYNDVESIRKGIENSLNRGATMRSVRYAFKALEDLNTAVENGVRLSTFIALRKANVPQDRAAFISRELTVNFNRKGEWGPFVNSLYLFFNASAQGSVRMAQAVTKSKKLQYALLGIVALGFMTDWLNHLLAGDDEDGKNIYDKIPDWVKERNLIIMHPGGKGSYTMIPLAYGYNVPYLMGQQAGAASRGARSPLQAAGTVAAAAFDSFNPIGSATSFWQMMSPTILDPGIQMLENKTWYGGQIYPPKFDSRKPDSESYFSSAPGWAVGLAKFMNESTGGNVGRPGTVDVSPETFEHYFEFLMGGTGKFVGNVWATGERVFKGDEWLPEKTPFIRRLYGKTTTESRRREFYEAWDAVDQANYEIRTLAKNHETEEANVARERSAAELRVFAQMKGVRDQLANMRKQRDGIRSNENLTDAEKRERVDQLVKRENEFIMRALAAYTKAQAESAK